MYIWPMSHSTVFIDSLLFSLPCWCFQWMHKYTQDSQKSAHNCTSDPSEWSVDNLLSNTGMLQVCQGPLNTTGHPAHTWPCRAPRQCRSVCWSRCANRSFTAISWQTGSFWTDWNKALTQTPPDTRPIREESHLNLQHHLKSGGKRSTQKSCKDATDSPSLSLPPKIHQHLDRTSGLLLRRAPSRHRNLVRTAAHQRVSCPHHNTQQKLWYPSSTQA